MPDEASEKLDLRPTYQAYLAILVGWIVLSAVLIKAGMFPGLGEILAGEDVFELPVFEFVGLSIWVSISALLTASFFAPQNRLSEWRRPEALKRSALFLAAAFSFAVFGGQSFITLLHILDFLFRGYMSWFRFLYWILLPVGALVLGWVLVRFAWKRYPNDIMTRRRKGGFAIILFLISWFLGFFTTIGSYAI